MYAVFSVIYCVYLHAVLHVHVCMCSNGCHPAIPDVGERLPLHYACANRCTVCIRSITSRNEGLTVSG